MNHVARWHYSDWDIACIGVTQFNSELPANPIYVTIVSKPLADGVSRRVVIREVNFDYTIINATIHVIPGMPSLDHKAIVNLDSSDRRLNITYENGAMTSQSIP